MYVSAYHLDPHIPVLQAIFCRALSSQHGLVLRKQIIQVQNVNFCKVLKFMKIKSFQELYDPYQSLLNVSVVRPGTFLGLSQGKQEVHIEFWCFRVMLEFGKLNRIQVDRPILHMDLRVVSNGVLLAVTLMEEKQLYGPLCVVINIQPFDNFQGRSMFK